MEPISLTRPLPVRVVSATTLAIILAWAVLNGDVRDIGVLAYPAIVGLQTAREWLWRLEVSPTGLHEVQGIGAPRDLEWRAVQAVLMPGSRWWRLNPALQVREAPNVQLTAVPEVATLIAVARDRMIPVEGDVGRISLARTLLPWVVVLVLASVLLAAEVAGSG